MNPVFLLIGLFCLTTTVAGSALELKSPDGRVSVTFDLKDFGADKSCPFYRVGYRGKEVLKDSRLGLGLEPAPLIAGLHLTGQKLGQNDATWKPICGERETVRDHYNQLFVELTEDRPPHRVMQLTFRAYDEGIAFCYMLPAQEAVKNFTIGAEQTRFSFTGDYTTWAVYAAQGDYAASEVPLSNVKPGAERPLTVRIAPDICAAVTEAGTVDYARMKLRLASDEPNTLEAFLDAEHGKAGKVTGTA